MFNRTKFLKKKMLFVWSIAMIVVVVSIGIIQFTTKKASTASVVVVEIETKTEETKGYTSFMSIPHFESEKINQPIHQWIDEQEQTFLEEVRLNEEFEGARSAQFRSHLNIKVDIEEVTDHLYNVILESQQYTGGANGMNVIKTFTVDVADQKILTIYDFLKDHDKTEKLLYSLIDEKLRHDEATYMYVFEDQLQDVLKNWKSLNWTFNYQGFTFYFDKYELQLVLLAQLKSTFLLNNYQRSYIQKRMIYYSL